MSSACDLSIEPIALSDAAELSVIVAVPGSKAIAVDGEPPGLRQLLVHLAAGRIVARREVGT